MKNLNHKLGGCLLPTLLIISIFAALIVSCVKDKRPKAPTLFNAEIEGNGICLTWQDNADNENYYLLMRDNRVAQYLDSNTVRAFDSFEFDTSYIYQIFAGNDHGLSGSEIIGIETPPKPTAPNAPTELTAIPAFRSVKLEWLDNSDNEIGFIFSRNENDLSLPENTTSFIDTGLTLGTEYSFSVLAYNDVGESEIATIETKTLGNWKAIWNHSKPQTQRGYRLYFANDGLLKLVWDGQDTTYKFVFEGYPCAIVGAYNNAGENYTEIICTEE